MLKSEIPYIDSINGSINPNEKNIESDSVDKIETKKINSDNNLNCKRDDSFSSSSEHNLSADTPEDQTKESLDPKESQTPSLSVHFSLQSDQQSPQIPQEDTFQFGLMIEDIIKQHSENQTHSHESTNSVNLLNNNENLSESDNKTSIVDKQMIEDLMKITLQSYEECQKILLKYNGDIIKSLNHFNNNKVEKAEIKQDDESIEKELDKTLFLSRQFQNQIIDRLMEDIVQQIEVDMINSTTTLSPSISPSISSSPPMIISKEWDESMPSDMNINPDSSLLNYFGSWYSKTQPSSNNSLNNEKKLNQDQEQNNPTTQTKYSHLLSTVSSSVGNWWESTNNWITNTLKPTPSTIQDKNSTNESTEETESIKSHHIDTTKEETHNDEKNSESNIDQSSENPINSLSDGMVDKKEELTLKESNIQNGKNSFFSSIWPFASTPSSITPLTSSQSLSSLTNSTVPSTTIFEEKQPLEKSSLLLESDSLEEDKYPSAPLTFYNNQPSILDNEFKNKDGLWNRCKSSYELLVCGFKLKFDETYYDFQHWYTTKFWDWMENLIDNLLESRIKPWIEESFYDRDMPLSVKHIFQTYTDRLWPDFREEFWELYYISKYSKLRKQALDELKQKNIAHHSTSNTNSVSPQATTNPLSNPSPPTLQLSPDLTDSNNNQNNSNNVSISHDPKPSFSLRNFILYHTIPYNVSLWGRLKDFWWCFFKLLRSCPLWGISSWFFLILWCLIDRSDEYQLASFILEVKGAQFLTVGVASALIGIFHFWRCITISPDLTRLDGLIHTCAENGPGSTSLFYLSWIGFIVTLILAWLSFLRLPYSEKKGEFHFEHIDRSHGRYYKPNGQNGMDDVPVPIDKGWQVIDKSRNENDIIINEDDDNNNLPFFTKLFSLFLPSLDSNINSQYYKRRGGQLPALLQYDLLIGILLFCIGLLFILFYRPYSLFYGDFFQFQWMFKLDLFFLKTFFGLLSFPFALFISPLGRFLTHIRRTGYDKNGVCIPMLRKEDHHS